MMRIKFDVNTIKHMSLFESFTRAKPKDCFFDSNGQLVYVIEPGNMARAIGRNGANIKKFESVLKRKVKIVEFNPDVIRFVSSLIAPAKARDIRIENRIITIKPADMETRGLLIGKSAKNLKNFEKITKKYFDIEEIKVI